jgi:two-component system NtrC family sensor kinase
MRLARKLILFMVIGLTVVLCGNDYYRVRREITAFEQDMEQDHAVLGQVLAHAIGTVWTSEGKKAALEIVANLQPHSRLLQVHWIDEESGQPIKQTDNLRITQIPLVLNGQVKGTIEISESRQFEQSYARSSMIRSLFFTLIALASAGLISTFLGIRFVGKPIEKLVAKARRIGAGDVESPLVLRQHDELGELAAEMNAMCNRLAETRYALSAETEERLRAEEQLRHAERLATIGKLASGIAHELGTPLGVALMRANMIASNEHVGREARDAAQNISEQIDRITNIVRQLLDFARGRGSSPPGSLNRRNPANLLAIAQRSATMLQPLAIKRSQLIEIVQGEQVPEPPANEEQIEQVLVNLVVNAIHASERPGKVIITVGLDKARPPADVTPPVWREGGEPRYAMVSVRDEGVGIAPEVLPRIFEPFFTTKHVGEGTGLGLSVAYGIVREHGGWIEVSSERNKGSLFTVYLPMEYAELV